MSEQKKRGKPISKKMVKVYTRVGINPHVFSGGKIQRECYYKTKEKLFNDLGYETKYTKAGLFVKIDKKFHSTNHVYMKYKTADKRLAPINMSNHVHTYSIKEGFNSINEDRNTFSDFVLDYTHGSLTYKSLLAIAKKMTPVVTYGM